MPGLTELALRGQMPGVSLRPNRKRRPTWTNRVKISRCYRDALVGDPNLSGVVKVKVHTDHYEQNASPVCSEHLRPRDIDRRADRANTMSRSGPDVRARTPSIPS
jgi:hypothetical protein